MNAQRLLDTFLDLVRIDSPSLREANVAAYCKQALEEAGCTVRFDTSAPTTGSDTGNLVALLPAAPDTGDASAPAPSLYLSAHMDTVSPGEGIEPVIADGVITSAGDTVLGGDDKVGVAAIIETVRTLAEAAASGRPHPAIGALLSVGEEIGLRGAHAMDCRDLGCAPCLVLDASGAPGVVVTGAPFHYLFEATFTGRAAHAGIEPERGVSAIALASKAVLAMQLGRLDERTTANVGIISGGNAFNIVPGSCVVTGEFRAMDEGRAREVKAQLAEALDAAVCGTDGSVAVEWEEEYRAFQIGEDDPLVQLVLAEARSLGLPAQTAVSGGGSDANVFAEKGMRALVLGTGMTDVHGLSESLAVADLEALARLCIAVAYASDVL
ncbi:MAG: M20/M25/M40 family metallo-hydrolase [Coriobacteriales bacterium]|jgi:tripeptide aminopeptidase|nr:M20/M25/M40 family metallo-hydrolase [Coriobacteriales bacterium]